MSMGIIATAFAGQASVKEENAIIDVLSAIETSKDRFGLESIDFEDLEIGNAIHIYDYINEEFVDTRVTFPLILNGELIAFATEFKIQNEVFFQISTMLANEVKDYIDSSSSIAFVYDRYGCYLYEDGKFKFLFESDMVFDERSVLNLDELNRETLNNIESNNYSQIELLQYTSEIPISRMPNTRYECAVDKVLQPSGSNICWAACVACISNYVNGTNFTAKSVAKDYWGNDYDYGLALNYVADFMYDSYDLYYTYKNKVPSDSVMTKNIKNDYPILAGFVIDYGSHTGRHAVVVYGIDTVKGYIYIMNPTNGFDTATATSDGYAYYTQSGNYLSTFNRSACYQW